MSKLTFTDLHLHTEYSLKDGMIRIADPKDKDRVKVDIILNAERRNTGAVTATDHGNMYGHAILAYVAGKFGLKHIPACEFYIAPVSRHIKNEPKGAVIYRHICGWAKNKEGYANLCRLQKMAYDEGFYYNARIDKEILDKYGDGIMWSDGCLGGTLSPLIVDGKIDDAYNEFLWYLNRFKNDFYLEYHNHGIKGEDIANAVKQEWANKHGVPIIACTDAHFYKKDDYEAHKALLSIRYANIYDDPTFSGFDGDGYWLMNDEELIERYPIEYLNNTQLIVDKVEDGIIEFGKIVPPKFQVPQWFADMEG